MLTTYEIVHSLRQGFHQRLPAEALLSLQEAWEIKEGKRPDDGALYHALAETLYKTCPTKPVLALAQIFPPYRDVTSRYDIMMVMVEVLFGEE